MTLVVSALMAPALLYLGFRYYSVGTQISEKWHGLRLLLPIILVSFYCFPISALADYYITGGIDVLKYPKALTYWFWFGLIFVFQLATWIIVADLLKLGSRFLSWGTKSVVLYHARAAIALFLLVFTYTGWKVYHDTTTIKTDRITVTVDGLPKSLDGFKLVHISDIQGDEYTGQEEIARYIRKVNEQNPDLTVFTGDLISYGTDFIQMSANEMGELKADYGTIAVVGDHDYWAGTSNVRSALQVEGIPLLQDQNHTLQTDSSNILITGVTEVYSKHVNPAVVDSLTSSSEADLKIFASHQVKDHLIERARDNSYDLMLAGHTHGGQIYVPFMGTGFSASERETKYVSGLYRERDIPINVNNGLGFTLAPIRYKAQPNISVITFKSK